MGFPSVPSSAKNALGSTLLGRLLGTPGSSSDGAAEALPQLKFKLGEEPHTPRTGSPGFQDGHWVCEAPHHVLVFIFWLPCSWKVVRVREKHTLLRPYKVHGSNIFPPVRDSARLCSVCLRSCIRSLKSVRTSKEKSWRASYSTAVHGRLHHATEYSSPNVGYLVC